MGKRTVTYRSSPARRWLGGVLQHWAWRLNDPHDSWMIDYPADGQACCMVRHGRYSAARSAAREIKGRIVGHRVTTISADPE